MYGYLPIHSFNKLLIMKYIPVNLITDILKSVCIFSIAFYVLLGSATHSFINNWNHELVEIINDINHIYNPEFITHVQEPLNHVFFLFVILGVIIGLFWNLTKRILSNKLNYF